MRSTKLTRLCLLFLLSLFARAWRADAIKCYQCKSIFDSWCAAEKIDAKSNIRKVDCKSAVRPNSFEHILPVTKCMKATTKDVTGTIVIRDCHFQTASQKADECRVEHNLHVEKCHICQGDLCNASSAGRFIAMGVVAIFAVVAVNVAL